MTAVTLGEMMENVMKVQTAIDNNTNYGAVKIT